jgi:SAM-dependent methyltransferase
VSIGSTMRAYPKRVLSRIKYRLSARMPPKQYWRLMGRFRSVAAVTSGCGGLAESQESGRAIVDLLKSLRAFDKDSVTLDIGSGLGRVEAHLAPLVRRCYGADISPTMVGKAQRLVQFENVEFRCTGGRDLAEWDDASVDLVFSFLVFQHLPRVQVERYIRAAFGRLRPDGRIVFQMMIDDDRVRADPPPSHPYGIRHYLRAGVRHLLESIGFVDIATYEMDGSPDQLRSYGEIVFVARRPIVT